MTSAGSSSAAEAASKFSFFTRTLPEVLKQFTPGACGRQIKKALDYYRINEQPKPGERLYGAGDRGRIRARAGRAVRCLGGRRVHQLLRGISDAHLAGE